MRVVFTCGRFNPPTIGHETLVETMRELAGDDPVRLFTTGSHDAKRNPLPPETKVGFLSRAFPGLTVERARDAFDALARLGQAGAREVIFVTGRDRAALAEEVAAYAADFGIETIRVHLMDRDEDAPSATQARAAAQANDFETFRSLAPGSGRDAELASDIFRAVRLGLGAEWRSTRSSGS